MIQQQPRVCPAFKQPPSVAAIRDCNRASVLPPGVLVRTRHRLSGPDRIAARPQTITPTRLAGPAARRAPPAERHPTKARVTGRRLCLATTAQSSAAAASRDGDSGLGSTPAGPVLRRRAERTPVTGRLRLRRRRAGGARLQSRDADRQRTRGDAAVYGGQAAAGGAGARLVV